LVSVQLCKHRPIPIAQINRRFDHHWYLRLSADVEAEGTIADTRVGVVRLRSPRWNDFKRGAR